MLAALRPIAVVVPPTTVSAGQSVTLPAGTSTAASGHTLASYAWTGSIVVTPPDQATGMVLAPTSGSAQVCVTVTDDAGRQDTAEVLLTPTSAAVVSIAGNTNPCAVLPVTVTVAPPTVTIQTNATQQFAATVANSTNTAVNWSVNNMPGGSATVGTVSATGLYTAPSVTSNLVVSVSAAWAGDASRVGSAQVTVIPVPVTVDVTPSSATVQAGGTQQFSAVVSNSSNSAVNWSVNGIAGGDTNVGTISAAGLYTAPTSVSASTVVAVTAAWSGDATRTGSSTVTVNPIPMQVPPQSSGGGGGGGGAFGLVELVGLAALSLLRRRRASQG